MAYLPSRSRSTSGSLRVASMSRAHRGSVHCPESKATERLEPVPQRQDVCDISLGVVVHAALPNRREALVVAGRRETHVAVGLAQQHGEQRNTGGDVVLGAIDVERPPD